MIMVVENTRDLAAYEKTGKYDGVYHVLHGAISPMLGIGPADIRLKELIKRLEGEVKEYVDAHRAELSGKSRTLTFGVVGYRISSKLMLATSKAAEAIATLKVMGHTELIKTTEPLDREALKKQPQSVLEQVGAYIKVTDEFYYDVEDTASMT